MKPDLCRRLGLVLGPGALFAAALVPSIAMADVPPGQVPAALQAAIKAEVEFQGHQYAGLCKAIDQPSNTGKYCATVLDLTSTDAEVTYGPVASEPTAHIVFFNENGTWSHPGGGPDEGEPPGEPLWVNDLQYGSAGGGFYWDRASHQVWTAERGWHSFSPLFVRVVAPLWVNQLDYGSRGGGFYLDPIAGQVWTAERGWHLHSMQ